ncbi:hypothetical protein BJ322DRAFT_1111639 [Thelephora terrestris]|uniref:Uncharacterized protein n=1 Tax=Thelephora terrestris TaxID=56493 RepID=A0A9P6HAK6_9AGAM|nr:hypothetical protein BJ322DRAFT_1111639 [Thelephora terrestris]
MLLPKRQVQNDEIYDDQSPDLMKTYLGNWTHVTARGGWYQDTYTFTTTPRSSFSFTFVGSQAVLFGSVSNLTDVGNWPTAKYVTDGVSESGFQMPHFDSYNSSLVYFETPTLKNGTHTINVTVTGADPTNPYVIDYFIVLPATVEPTAIRQSPPVIAVVGVVVAGIAGIAILTFAAYYFLTRRSRGNRTHYCKKPGAGNARAGEGVSKLESP